MPGALEVGERAQVPRQPLHDDFGSGGEVVGVKALVTGTSVPMKPDAANVFQYPRPGIPVLIVFYGIPGLIGVVVGFIALCLGIRFIWGGNTTWRVSFSFLSKFRR